MGNKNKHGFATRALHAGYNPHEHNASRTVPLYQSTAFLFKDTDHAARLFKLEEEGHIYTRINNPTVDALENRIASLENGVAGLAFASGMAAISASLLTILRAGDEIVASSSLYGGTFNLFSVTLPKIGITTKFVDISDPENVERAIRKETKLVFVETIGNPRIDVPDLEVLAGIAHKHGLPFFVDNTTASPYLCQPLDHGADVVLHSTSKFIGGHGGSLGGLMVAGDGFDWAKTFPFLEPYVGIGPSPFATCARVEALRDYGGAMSPFNAFQFIQGVETLAIRMQRHSENASSIAGFLYEHPAVEYVNYPTVPDHPSTETAKKYLPNGYGALLSFGLKGGYEAGKKVVNSCQLIHHLANLGDTKTLILHPASTSHEQLSAEDKIAAGSPEELIRMSIGIEDVADIIADLKRGLPVE